VIRRVIQKESCEAHGTVLGRITGVAAIHFKVTDHQGENRRGDYFFELQMNAERTVRRFCRGRRTGEMRSAAVAGEFLADPYRLLRL